MLFIAAPLFAAEVPALTCKAPDKGANDAAWTSYYSCMDTHIKAHRDSIASHNKAIDAAMEQMREDHTFLRK